MKTYPPDRIIDAPQVGALARPAIRSFLNALRSVAVFVPALLLVFSVLAFGATQDWSQFVLRAGAAALLCVWALASLFDEKFAFFSNPLFGPIALAILIGCIQLGFSRTAYRHATVFDLLQYLAYAAIFFVVCDFWRKEAARNRILILLTIFGFVLAVFAIVQGLTSKDQIYWVVKPHFGGSVYGPYVNRNHYAGLMELLAPVPFALAALRDRKIEQRGLLIFAGMIMGISIFASQSRAGMAAFTLEMLILCLVLLRVRRSIRTGAAIVFGAGILIAFVVVLGGGELFQRFSSISDQTRLSILKDSVTMFAHRPILGWGLGTFPTIYPHFRSFYTDTFVNQAHNDMVQFAVEAGSLGIIAGIWFVVALYRKAFHSLEQWTGSISDAAVLAGLVGCTGLLFHSFFDFNLHIPANAVAFFLSCALATMGHSEEHRRRDSAFQ